MKTRLLSISMILIVFLSLFPPIPSAAAATNDYLIDNGILIKYTGKAANIVIPKGVTTIGREVFYKNWTSQEKMLSVTMPDSVTTIEEGAFMECKSLVKVTLSKNLKSIGLFAFKSCPKLKSIQLPYGLERIQTMAFDASTLLTVPSTVKYLGYSAVDSLAEKKEFVILGDGILYRYNGMSENVTIPKNVKIIGEQAFTSNVASKPLKSVTLPGSVRQIWDNAFIGCRNLEKVTLSEGIERISLSAFHDSPKLVKINIPKSLEDTSLVSFRSRIRLGNHSEDFDIRGNGVLYKYTGTASHVVIPEGVKIIGCGAFYENRTMKSVVIPNSVVQIGPSAFSNCGGLTQIDIPDSVKIIEASAFMSCYQLKKVKLPSELTHIEERTFLGCNMERIVIPDKVTSIGEAAFKSCYSLFEVLIPNGVKCIEKYAFDYSDVNGVILPSSVTYIGMGAFGSSTTTELTLQNGNTRVDELAFYSYSDNRTNVTITSPPGGSVQRMAARKKLKFKAYTKQIPPPTVFSREKATSIDDMVLVNGVQTSVQLYTIDYFSYCKLNDLAAALTGSNKQFSVMRDTKLNTIQLTSSIPYAKVGGELLKMAKQTKYAVKNNAEIYLNGNKIAVPAYDIENDLYINLFDIMESFDIECIWFSHEKGIVIDTTKGYTK